MYEDIFVDNNLSKYFCNPIDNEYKKFIKWLEIKGSLVVSMKLIHEYNLACSASGSGTSIPAIINKLLIDGRLNKISNKQLRNNKIKNRIINQFRSNPKDHEYIKLVIMSDRKYALSEDDNLCFDIINFPGKATIVESRPENIPYDRAGLAKLDRCISEEVAL